MSDQFDLKQCAHCAAHIPVEAEMCASCGTSDPEGRRLAAARAAPPQRRVPNRAPWTVTRAIVWSNVAFLLFCLYVQWTHRPQDGALPALVSFNGLNYGLAYTGAYDHSAVVNGEWWRSITGVWLHAGGIHIGLNMWILSRFGNVLEDILGGRRFFVLYFVSGIGSVAAVSLWFAVLNDDPGSARVVGASGAIFGVLGAFSAFTLRHGTERGRMIGRAVARDIVLMLVLGALIPMISNTGHIGGLIPGVVFGLVVRERFGDRLRAEGASIWTVAAVLCVVVTVVALGFGVANGLAHLGDGR